MRITESTLRSYVRQILQEKVFGNQAFVYHGSSLPPDKFSKIIESDTFDPGKGAGALYGKGLYTVYDEDTSSKTQKGDYGAYIYKLKVNLNGFLIFDSDVCQKVYGKEMSLKEQLFKMGMQDVYSRIKKSWPNLQKPAYFSDEEFTFEHFFDEDRVALTYTAELADVVKKYVSNKVAGLIFTGSHDGKVCVIYDPSTVVLIGWKQPKSQEFKRIEPGKAQVQRSATSLGNPERHIFSSKKSVAIFIKALENLNFSVDKGRLSTVFSGFIDDSLLGKPSTSPPGSRAWNPDDPQMKWESAMMNYMSIVMSKDIIDPKPDYPDFDVILKEAMKLAFPKNLKI